MQTWQLKPHWPNGPQCSTYWYRSNVHMSNLLKLWLILPPSQATLSSLLHKHQESVWAKHCNILKAHAAFARRSTALCQHAAELCVSLELPARAQVLTSKATEAGTGTTSSITSSWQQQQQGRAADMYASCQLLCSSMTGADAKECVKSKGFGFILEGECFVMCNPGATPAAAVPCAVAAAGSAGSDPGCAAGSVFTCRARSSCATGGAGGSRASLARPIATAGIAAALAPKRAAPGVNFSGSSSSSTTIVVAGSTGVPASKGCSGRASAPLRLSPGVGKLGGAAVVEGRVAGAGAAGSGERQQPLMLAQLSKGDMLSFEALRAFEDKHVSCLHTIWGHFCFRHHFHLPILL